MADTSDPIARLDAALAGRYRIERQIGEGGMATVYLAEDLKHHRRVALKVLKPELAAVVGAERFLAEIETTANLTHPNILPLFDSGEVDGFLFYAMPYVEGETLRERLDREHQLPIDEAVGIAKGVAEALEYAHTQGVIHRDVKPANILLQSGKPVVSDFGIALAVGSAGGGRLTETGLSMGTPHYMSPEQATGDQRVDPRADVYALGCVLYEMLVGEPPYTGSTAQAVLGRIIQAEPVSATESRRSVPSNVDAAIRKALEKLPADRFKGARDFAAALDEPGFRHGTAAAAGVVAGRGLWNPLSIAASAFAVALAVGLGWPLLRPDPPQPVSRVELTLPTGLEVYIPNGSNIQISPDGSRIVFAGQSEDGSIQLWVREMDRLEPVSISGTDDARSPRFSPDGSRIAFNANSGLHTVSLAGSPPSTLVSDSVQEGVGGIAWGSDGFLYFRKVGEGIWRVPEEGGEPEEVTTLSPDEGGHVWPDVLPGGRALLFTRDLGGPDEDAIALLSLQTGEIRTLFPGAMARYSQSGHILYTRSADLLAVPFDLDRLEVTGEAVSLVEGVQVNAGSASYFDVSSSGTLIYHRGTSSEGATPLLIGRDGSEEVLDDRVQGLLHHPAISPDGRRVAFGLAPNSTEAGDVWIYDRDQSTFSRFTFEGGTAPFWSPDGEEVAFISDQEGADAVFARLADASAAPRRLRTRPGDDPIWDALWTPDGDGILYAAGTSSGPQWDIVYVPFDSTEAPVSVVQSSFSEGMPSLSPDGRWLAYTSNESGRSEVYVRPFPGAGARTQISTGGGTAPVWSPAGTEILYYGPEGGLIAAEVATDPGISVESREVVTDRENISQEILRTSAQYDVFPDGEQILLLGGRYESGGRGIVLVQNFFEELAGMVSE